MTVPAGRLYATATSRAVTNARYPAMVMRADAEDAETLDRAKDATGRLYVTAMSRAVTNARYPAMIAAPAMRPKPRSR